MKQPGSGPELWEPTEGEGSVNTDTAPKPVGAYPHARRGGRHALPFRRGPRQPGTNAIPGGPSTMKTASLWNTTFKAQTSGCRQRRRIVEEAGATMDQRRDVTTFLVDMKRDFAGYNEVWAETLGKVGPTRTTFAIRRSTNPHCCRNEGHRPHAGMIPEFGGQTPQTDKSSRTAFS